MKTSLLQLIKDWLKKNYIFLLLVACIIGFVVYTGIRESFIVSQTKKMDKLVFENSTLTLDRQFLEQKIKRLQLQNGSIEKRNDSLKAVLSASKKQLAQMQEQHKKEIDSLLNVPNDTIFVRLQPLYPNYDTSPLIYPFSGSQIRQIYTTAISYPLLTQEFQLQGKALNVCTELNTGYESSISNLKGQVSLLEQDVSKCDEQVGNYKKQVIQLNKQVDRGKFLKRTFLTTTGIAALIAILK